MHSLKSLSLSFFWCGLLTVGLAQALESTKQSGVAHQGERYPGWAASRSAGRFDPRRMMQDVDSDEAGEEISAHAISQPAIAECTKR
jgi:hypothetical protein